MAKNTRKKRISQDKLKQQAAAAAASTAAKVLAEEKIQGCAPFVGEKNRFDDGESDDDHDQVDDGDQVDEVDESDNDDGDDESERNDDAATAAAVAATVEDDDDDDDVVDDQQDQQPTISRPVTTKPKPSNATPSGKPGDISVSITLEEETAAGNMDETVTTTDVAPSDIMPSEGQFESSQLLKGAWSKVALKFQKGQPKGQQSSPTITMVPRPIQLLSWPILLPTVGGATATKTNNNLIGISSTGSGKTLAFGLPMLVTSIVLQQQKGNHKNMCGLVLAPTRELASQIERELKMAAACLLAAVTDDANAADHDTDAGDTTTALFVAAPTKKNKQKKKKWKSDIKVVGVYGGGGSAADTRDDQMDLLCSSMKTKGLVIAATPGRLVDLLEEPRVIKALTVTNRVGMVVLDEADRLAACKDMSKQIDAIFKAIGVGVGVDDGTNSTRVCLFSATYPRSVTTKWNQWVGKPRICIKVNTTTSIMKTKGSSEADSERKKRKAGGGSIELSQIPAHVSQTFHYCSDDKNKKDGSVSNNDKSTKVIAALAKIRRDEFAARARRKGLCIIFFNRIKTLESVAKLMARECPETIKFATFHGKQDQSSRARTMSEFKCGKIPTLLATDVAARGIHVSNIEYVLNYDIPETLDQYIHRCGRAGRSQKAGKPQPAAVHSFFTDEIAPLAGSLVALLSTASGSPPIHPKLLAIAASHPNPSEGNPPKKKQAKKKKTV